ncbi:DUF6624 domain-containing protein [Streptomyces sp. NPDC017993]|uniref:DUF6624 domain-containing protein n=1 Tax=Streptomyces sp. NPDC017993 TaxID=3365027 RepID=UPI0037A418A5
MPYIMIRAGLAAELSRRADTDRRARNRWSQTGEAGDLARIDADNTAWIKSVIAEHGWPGTALVGDRGADEAWLLVQHADRAPEFQGQALQQLKSAVEAGDAPARHLAYLTDRVLVGAGKPHLYGTQYADDGNSLRPQPVQDPDGLDERRAAMGLDSAAAYDQCMRKTYSSGNSGRPDARDNPCRPGRPDGPPRVTPEGPRYANCESNKGGAAQR